MKKKKKKKKKKIKTRLTDDRDKMNKCQLLLSN